MGFKVPASMLHLVCTSISLLRPNTNDGLRIFPSVHGNPKLDIPYLRA